MEKAEEGRIPQYRVQHPANFVQHSYKRIATLLEDEIV
jgi:hypothetical protein